MNDFTDHNNQVSNRSAVGMATVDRHAVASLVGANGMDLCGPVTLRVTKQRSDSYEWLRTTVTYQVSKLLEDIVNDYIGTQLTSNTINSIKSRICHGLNSFVYLGKITKYNLVEVPSSDPTTYKARVSFVEGLSVVCIDFVVSL